MVTGSSTEDVGDPLDVADGASTEPGRGDREQGQVTWEEHDAFREPQRSPVVVTGSSRPTTP